MFLLGAQGDSDTFELENPSYLEEELAVAIVAHSAAYFHWTEQGVDNQAANHVAGKVGRLRPIWKLIRFSNFELSNQVDGAAQQRRKRLQCPDIASLKEEVLVGRAVRSGHMQPNESVRPD